jgi:hypothetical protein
MDVEEVPIKETAKCKGTICWPLIVYIIITVIALLAILFTPQLDASSKSFAIVITFIWALFWGFILWKLCNYCHWGWAWILLFIPFIINVLFFMVVLLAMGAFDAGGDFPNVIVMK